MATPNTQRELIDFLWDWTNPLGSWSKLLVELVTNKQAALDQNERKRVFEYFMQDIGFIFNPSFLNVRIIKFKILFTKWSDTDKLHIALQKIDNRG